MEKERRFIPHSVLTRLNFMCGEECAPTDIWLEDEMPKQQVAPEWNLLSDDEISDMLDSIEDGVEKDAQMMER